MKISLLNTGGEQNLVLDAELRRELENKIKRQEWKTIQRDIIVTAMGFYRAVMIRRTDIPSVDIYLY